MSPPTVSDADEPSPAAPMPDASDWPEAIVEPQTSPALERLFRRRTGLAPAVVPYVAPHPWAYRPFLFLMNPELEALDERLGTQICFVVARDNACRFCYGSFRSFLRIAGFSAAELEQLETELHRHGQDSAERAALEFAVEISQGRQDAGESIASLRAEGWPPRAVREIAGVAVASTFINRAATMLAIPLNEDLEALTNQWFFGALRPVLRPLLNGWQYLAGAGPSPLRPGEAEGPFAPWIERLRGTCVGRLFHELTDQWLREETALPVRTKLFVLAVVAHGLGHEDLEERATDLLKERCGMERSEVGTVVEHLQGDSINDREADLLKLARVSIRYEAERIQTTTQPHTRSLSRIETIDAVATLGLSNALARLRVLAPLDD